MSEETGGADSQLDGFSLQASHRERLRWFEQRAGQVSGFPKPLPGGQFLVSTPKGIYKPADLPYALSIRVNLESPYSDGLRVDRPNGSWALAYHQENPDAAQRDREFTNVGLMRCIEDAVPVGVLFERPRVGGRSQYEVLGLALPVDWRDGYFFFEGFGPNGPELNVDTYADVLLGSARGDEMGQSERDGAPEPPGDDYDARLRAVRSIVARQGQRRFRALLLSAYGGQCAITGESVTQVLDAAHIRPYRGPDSNHVTNGLLLRTDLHSLLDLQLLAIHPEQRTVVLSKTLRGSTTYGALNGVPLREPSTTPDRPAASALEYTWSAFLEAEVKRPDA